MTTLAPSSGTTVTGASSDGKPTGRVARAPGSGTTAVGGRTDTEPAPELDFFLDRYKKLYSEGVEVARGANQDETMVWRLWASRIDGGVIVEFADQFKPPAESGKVARGGGAGAKHTTLPIQVMGVTTKPPTWAWVGTVQTNVASVRVHTPTGTQVVYPFDRQLFDRRYFVVFLDIRPQYFVALAADGRELGRDNLGTPAS